MILDEIGQYLENNGIGTQGHDLFLGVMPDPNDKVDPVVAIFEYLGAPIWRTHDSKYDRTRLQFQCRSLDYAAGKQKLMDVFNLVDNIVNRTIGGVRYQRIEAIQSPAFLNRDENDRILFVFNAQVTKEFS